MKSLRWFGRHLRRISTRQGAGRERNNSVSKAFSVDWPRRPKFLSDSQHHKSQEQIVSTVGHGGKH